MIGHNWTDTLSFPVHSIPNSSLTSIVGLLFAGSPPNISNLVIAFGLDAVQCVPLFRIHERRKAGASFPPATTLIHDLRIHRLDLAILHEDAHFPGRIHLLDPHLEFFLVGQAGNQRQRFIVQ